MVSKLIERTNSMAGLVNNTTQIGVREYSVISEFGLSSVGSEAGLHEPLFRLFTPVKEQKGRKLNPIYGHTFNPCKDTLMDYPTIVQYRLGKMGSAPWTNYNRLVSLHISKCPLQCWHCYVEECLRASCSLCGLKSASCNGKRRGNLHIKEDCFSGSEIVDKFMEQRAEDRKAGLFSNILRITGGEPFLAPQLLVDVLEELRHRGLDREIFLWTETNLVPLILENDSDTLVPDHLLGKLGLYHNFCVHPCFHGLDETNFQQITGEEIGDFDILVSAFKRLVDAQIDVYLTFGSNTSSPKLVEAFYNCISRIDRLLPLRFCLIEYDLDYKPVRWRRDKIPEFADMHERVYDRFQLIEIWSKLLEKNTGYSYGDIPRHLVPIT